MLRNHAPYKTKAGILLSRARRRTNRIAAILRAPEGLYRQRRVPSAKIYQRHAKHRNCLGISINQAWS